jgi:chromatin segregation and condensation protein Rec8/ScpA/Scc1 (kleisin family)
MTAAMRKPFYLRPPWNILFELSKLEKLTPWNVNIAYLLSSFLLEMERTGKVDFRASGMALDSSALIYLMKSKLLLTLQEPPAPPKTPQEVWDDVLKGEKLTRLHEVAAQPVLPAVSDILPQLDIFLMEIELQMEKLYALLCEKVKGVGIIEFSALIKGIARIEAVRTFILLLFLAQSGRVSLWQDEETEEIYIAVGNLNVGRDEKPSS